MPVLSFFLSLFSFGFFMSSIQVRPATLRDAKAIAQIHTVSAQEAYKGLVPDEQLKSMSSVEKRQAYWREAIEYCEPQVQVAVDGEKIVGIVDESDVLMHVFGRDEKFKEPVATAMVRKLDKLDVTSPMAALLPVFDRGHVAIVMDDQKFLGLITRIDLLNYLRRRAQ